MTPRSGITIDPDPAIEGRLVRISLPDGGPWYISLDPSGEVQRLNVTGREAEVVAPGVGGQSFTITNLGSPLVGAGFDIVSTDP